MIPAEDIRSSTVRSSREEAHGVFMLRLEHCCLFLTQGDAWLYACLAGHSNVHVYLDLMLHSFQYRDNVFRRFPCWNSPHVTTVARYARRNSRHQWVPNVHPSSFSHVLSGASTSRASSARPSLSQSDVCDQVGQGAR